MFSLMFALEAACAGEIAKAVAVTNTMHVAILLHPHIALHCTSALCATMLHIFVTAQDIL